MTSYQRLQPYFQDFTAIIRKVRTEQGLTNQDLTDKSGVSYSTVCKISADTQENPKIFDGIALLDALGLSSDEVFGLQPAFEREELLRRIDELEIENGQLRGGAEKVSDQRDRIHELEVKVTRLKGEVGRLNAVKEADDEEKERLIKEVAAWKPIVYILLFLSTVLVASLGYYLVMDFHLSDVGLILFGKFSIYGAVLILILFVSLGTIAWIAIREIRAWRRSIRDSESERK